MRTHPYLRALSAAAGVLGVGLLVVMTVFRGVGLTCRVPILIERIFVSAMTLTPEMSEENKEVIRYALSGAFPPLTDRESGHDLWP